MSSKSFAYSLVTAFASNTFAGNPAAILFVEDEDTFSNAADMFANISANFNQPMLSVISPARNSTDDTLARFGIRWFTAKKTETPLCGHGTLAAAGAIFSELGRIKDIVTAIEFVTHFGETITARKAEEGRLEIVMPAGSLRALTSEESQNVKPILQKALGPDVVPLFLGTSPHSDSFEKFLYVDLDPAIDLATLKIASEPLKSSGYRVHVFTTDSPTDQHAFVSRMFAPNSLPGTGEDHVCGAAHCLLTPYWVEKKELHGLASLNARMVSERGGDLNVSWAKEEKTVALRGHVRVFANGEFQV